MKIIVSIFVIFLVMLVASSCGSAITAQKITSPTATSTPDSCSSKYLPGEVDKAHELMREFDDASLLGSNTPRDQLPLVISDMQRIRRATEDQIVPICLATLKQLQLAHMNTVISTLLAFLGGADQNTLNQGTDLARQEHNAYALEYARLLGLTVVVPPTPTPGLSVTDTPPPATPVISMVVNTGPSDVNLFSDDSVDSTVVGTLAVNESARVVMQSPDGLWIQVEIPGQAGQVAWVQASLVTLSPFVP
jgi:hypothetical protein